MIEQQIGLKLAVELAVKVEQPVVHVAQQIVCVGQPVDFAA